MSCQRCGGVLATELAATMHDLVCGMAVIEGRYCHCNDVDSLVQVKLPRKGRDSLAGESSEMTASEGEPQ